MLIKVAPQPTPAEYAEYRRKKAETASQFEDFAYWALQYYAGIVVVPYRSREWQINVGENGGGFEIKHDEKFDGTGNLWIEVKEKGNTSRKEWTYSGIYRPDNSRYYMIGSYKRIYIFAKRHLQLLLEEGKYKTLENNTGTSIGFLMPSVDAEKYAADVLVIKSEDIPPNGDRVCKSPTTKAP